MSDDVVQLFSMGIGMMDKATYGLEKTSIQLIEQGAKQPFGMSPVVYYPEKDLLPSHLRQRPIVSTSPSFGYFVINGTHARQLLEMEIQKQPTFPPPYLIAGIGASCLWQKVHWHQLQAIKPEVAPTTLLLTAEDISACSTGKISSPVTSDHIQVMLDMESESHFQQHGKRYLRDHKNETFARYLCQQAAETAAIGWVVTNIPKLQNVLAFVQELKQRADAKVS